MNMNAVQTDLDSVYQEVMAQYEWLNHEPCGINLIKSNGEVLSQGDVAEPKPIGNLISLVLLSLVSELKGWDFVFEHLGTAPYNDHTDDDGVNHQTLTPFNPLIESGLLAMSDLLIGALEKGALKTVKKRLEEACGIKLVTPKKILLSPSQLHRLEGIASFLHHYGITDPSHRALELLLSVMGFELTLNDLAMLGMTIVNQGINPVSGKRVFDATFSNNALVYMMTCGIGATHPTWNFHAGLPALVDYEGRILGLSSKGVSMAILPPEGSHDEISGWSSDLVATLSTRLHLKPFSN